MNEHHKNVAKLRGALRGDLGNNNVPLVNPAKISDDFQRFGLQPGNVPEEWEDGMRTGDGGPGTYEWWYFDADLADGGKAVIIFYTKEFTEVDQPLTPIIRLDVFRGDGTFISKALVFDGADFSAATDTCNVTVGNNYFRGNLQSYEIHVEDSDLNFTATLQRTTQSWRPKTGHMVFGPEEQKQFNWVVAVPAGDVNITYTYQGASSSVTGFGYHDHNWGNIDMRELINHWYWSRAKLGPYNIIAAEITAEKNFDNDNIMVFNVSKDGQTIADDGDQVTLYRTLGKVTPDSILNKDISEKLVFIYDNPNDTRRYEYYLYKQQTILASDLLETALGGKGREYWLTRLRTGFDGAYFRFAGRSELRVYDNNQLVEEYESPFAIWELMYFGKPLACRWF